MAMAWMLRGDCRIDACKLEDDWLVFHGGDAQTHRLSGIVGLVFEVFLEKKVPLSIMDIVNQVNKLENDALDDESVELAVKSLAFVHILETVEEL
jgi:hypothetical protein